jgi:hypothetical protein
MSIKARVKRVAHAVGVKLANRNPSKTAAWDGHTVATRGQSVSTILHDIAHWQVAPPWRRKYRDFGLGAGNESGDAARRVSHDLADNEERRASLLGIAWLFHLGEEEEAVDDLHDHGWLSYNPTFHPWQNLLDAWSVVCQLRRRGLLDERGRPTASPFIRARVR